MDLSVGLVMMILSFVVGVNSAQRLDRHGENVFCG